MWGLLLISLTTMLFLLPLFPALQEWRLKRDISPLKIVQAHAGRADYFSDSFRALIQGDIAALTNHASTSVPRENYCVVETNGAFIPNRKENQNRITHRAVLAFGVLWLPDNLVFLREVYSKQSILGGDVNRFRAVLAEDELLIGRNSTVLRWAHARTVRVGQDCHLPGRLSAKEEIVLEMGCTFTRIHAPCVKFGPDPSELVDERMVDDAPESEHKAMLHLLKSDDGDNRWVVDNDLEFPENGVFCGDIVARGNILIRHGAQIMGSVKANGTLRIERNVTITGSLVSSKNLIIEGRCAVAGPVVAERQIDIHSGAVIGGASKPTTVSAPVIRVAGDTVVYGTVWAWEQGLVLPSGEAG